MFIRDRDMKCVGITCLLLTLQLAIPSHAQMLTAGQFEVSNNGAAIYTIPLQVAPGIAGMEPRLSLRYHSQSGNGLLGVGWRLGGLGEITRCPRTLAQDGISDGVNYDSNDRYCLDGQRLIAVSGNYGADGTEYRTERASFSRIVSYGNAGNGPAWFKVWTRADQQIEYGHTDDARIEAQGKNSVHLWALNRIEDTSGNYLTASYTEDTANGNHYPTRIDYGGNHKANQPTFNSVRFSYEVRPDSVPAYQAGSMTKNDVRLKTIQTFNAETLTKEYRLTYEPGLQTQRSRLVKVQECTDTELCLPALAFAHDSAQADFSARISSAFSDTHFAGYELVAGDVNGDGKQDLMYLTDGSAASPNAKGMQRSVFLGAGDGTFGPRLTSSFQDTHFAGYTLITGDINGDGKLDIMYVTDGSASPPNGKGMQRSVFLGTGDGTFGPRIATTFSDMHFAGYELIAADLNGDHKLDLMYITDGSASPPNGKGMQRSVFLGNGDGTFGARVATTFPDTNFAEYQLVVGDLNGDSKADIMYVTDGSASAPNGKGQQRSVFLGNGDGTFGARIASTFPDTHFAGYELIALDLNGDRKLDLMYITDGSVNPPSGKGQQRSVFFGTGDGTFAPRITSAFTDTHFAGYQLKIGDFNGDGKPDLLYITDGSVAPPSGKGMQRSVFTGNGDGSFATRITTVFPDTHFAGYELLAGDVNGDGKTDITYITDGSAAAPNSKGQQRSVFLATPEAENPDLVKSFATATDISTQLVYKPIADSGVYTRDTAEAADEAASPTPLVEAQPALYVVASVMAATGTGHTTRTEYTYGGLKRDQSGRGLLGFRWQRILQTETGLQIYREHLQHWPFTGVPSLIRKSMQGAGHDGVLQQVATSYQCINPDSRNSEPCQNGAGQRYFVHATRRVTSSWDLDGTIWPVITTDTEYDRRGNPIKIRTRTSDSHRQTIHNSYSYNSDDDHWHPGRLLSSWVINVTPITDPARLQ